MFDIITLRDILRNYVDFLRQQQVIDVKHFFPKTGPWEGGTNVTIEGVNLGKTFSDIVGGITVAGIPCHPYEVLYVPTQRIVCLVDGLKTSESRRGPVIVRVSDFKGESADYYEFVDPIIESVYPTSGSISGTLKLTIRGKNLNAGSSIQASIDAALPCAIISINATHVICQTTASNFSQSGNLLMTFDRGVRRFTYQIFQYIEDRNTSQPELNVVKYAKGVSSGGTVISVSGNNFQHIQVLRSNL